MKPIDCVAQVLLLGRRVDAHAVGAAARRRTPRRRAARPSSQVRASWISSDSKPTADELARQLLVLGAGIGAPVVFVQVHEHVEHETTIPAAVRRRQAAADERRAAGVGARALRPRSTRWNSCPGRRATRPSSSSSSSRACSSAAAQPVRAISASRPTGSKPSASSSGSPGAARRRLGAPAAARGGRRAAQLLEDVARRCRPAWRPA